MWFHTRRSPISYSVDTSCSGTQMPKESSTGCSGEAIPAIKIAIVEDLRTLRDGYCALIDGTENYICTGTYRTMEEILSQIGGAVPDVALVDIGLPGMSGIEGIRVLKERFPD